MIPILKERVTGKEFDEIIRTYSGGSLWSEQVFPPTKWMGELFVCTSMGLSHSRSWCVCYSLQKMEEWDGPVYVYGATDEDWFRRVRITGQNWYGFRVSVVGLPASEYVLNRKLMFVREPYPKARPSGQNYMGME